MHNQQREKAMMTFKRIAEEITSEDLEKIEEQVRALGYGDVEVWDAYGNKLR